MGIRYSETTVAANGTSYLDFDHAQNFQSSGEGENLSLFGYQTIDHDGDENTAQIPDPANTATLEEAQRALLDVYGPLTVSNNGETARFPIVEEHEYDNWLPSLNVNYALADDKILRFAASKSLARPEFNRLFPSFYVRENIFGAESNSQIRGAKLNPYLSRNLDVSFEWYFDEASLFSVALFDKKFSDFSTTRSYNSYYRDVRADYFDVSQIDPNDTSSRAPRIDLENVTAEAPTPENVLLPFAGGDNQSGCMINRELELVNTDNQNICDVAVVSESVNGTGGFVRGIEMSFQHNLTYLPGVWSGLGFVTNYTYADSQTDEESIYNPSGDLIDFTPEAPFVGTSEHTFNTTLFWEKDGKLIRLAYNYRTDYLTNLSVNDGGSHWVEGFDSLDLSANWTINKNFTLSFQAVNLTDTVVRRYDVRRPIPGETLAGESFELGSQPTGRTVRLENTGTIYRLGLRVNF
jgi:TonB-dependent receptor